MASELRNIVPWHSEYPTSDGRPMAETDWHRILMTVLIETLEARYAKNEMVYVSGNLLIVYEPGNIRKHVAPDVFVVKGVKKHRRPNYLVWEEGQAPDVVIELTSKSTRMEDQKKKYRLYQDVFHTKEYFLFDPFGDYLRPPLQGYRLVRGKYHPIPALQTRLPSQVLDLHLERDGKDLRLYDPSAQKWLPTPAEALATATQAQLEAENARLQVQIENAKLEAENERLRAGNEIKRLQNELEDLRRRLGQKP
jgi:Uma2 family endonuclease